MEIWGALVAKDLWLLGKLIKWYSNSITETAFVLDANYRPCAEVSYKKYIMYHIVILIGLWCFFYNNYIMVPFIWSIKYHWSVSLLLKKLQMFSFTEKLIIFKAYEVRSCHVCNTKLQNTCSACNKIQREDKPAFFGWFTLHYLKQNIHDCVGLIGLILWRQ